MIIVYIVIIPLIISAYSLIAFGLICAYRQCERGVKMTDIAEIWNKNLEHLQSGGFGDATKPETLLNYWKAQESAGYPYASENVKYFEDILGIKRYEIGEQK